MSTVRDRQRSAHGMAAGSGARRTLVVEREAKIADVVGAAGAGLTRLEASGVLVRGGRLWVIFDNVPCVAWLHPSLLPAHPDTGIYRTAALGGGYEDLADDDETGEIFLLVEAAQTGSGELFAQVREFDAGLGFLRSRRLDAPLERENKGIEGLTCVRRDGRRFLLGLPEGNGGQGGRAGRRPGTGLVHVFTEDPAVPRSVAAGPDSWALLTTIRLPESLPFSDFSGLSHRDGRLAVVSQECSQLWVGQLDPCSWRVVDEGTVYDFPRDERWRVVYGTIEGVSWLTDRSLAVVSDKAKRSQPRRMRSKDQSVHVVRLPEPA